MSVHETGIVRVEVYSAWCEGCDWLLEVQVGDRDAFTRRAARTKVDVARRMHEREHREDGMTTHTYHEDVHTHGLADDCPRCEEIANDPLARADADLLLILSRSTNLKTETDHRAYGRLVAKGVPVS